MPRDGSVASTQRTVLHYQSSPLRFILLAGFTKVFDHFFFLENAPFFWETINFQMNYRSPSCRALITLDVRKQHRIDGAMRSGP